MSHPVFSAGRKFALALASMLLAFVPLLAAPSEAQAADAVLSVSSCDFLIDPVAKALCIAANGNLPGVPGIPNPANIISDTLVKPFLQQVVKAEAESVGESLNSMMTFINKSTTPTLTKEWFTTQYALLFGMATVLMVGLGYSRLVVATKDQDVGEFGSTLFAMIGFLGFTGFIPGFVSLAVAAADGPITQGLLDSVGKDSTKKLTELSTTLVNSDIQTAIMVPLVVLFFGIIGAVLTELELYLRLAAIFVFTAMAVFAAAMVVGGKWTVGLAKPIFLGLLGLILLKPIMALLFVIAVHIVGSETSDATPVVLGSIMLLLVPIVSWSIYKKVSNHDVDVSKVSRHAARLARAVRA